MKKLFALVAIFAFIFAACGEEEDMPDSGTLKTTLTVSNLSDYGLLRVEYSSVDFGDINSGKENTKEVSAGTKYVFFFLQTTNGKIRCKTEALTCNEGVKNEITITNNSAITTAVTERRDTLKNLLYTLNNEPANPKIKILYDNYPVSSDGIIPLYDVATGSNKYIVLKIVNEGEHDLVITGTKPQISGTNAAQVVTENYPSVRLAYNEFINLSMQFTPTITGNNSFTITIINNDQINGTYTVQVTAKVINTWQKLHGASGRRYGIYRAVSNGEGGMYAGGYTSNNTGALFNIDQNGEVKTISSYPSYDGTIGPEGIGMGIARDDYFSVYKAFYNDKEYYITKSTSPAIPPTKIPISLIYNDKDTFMWPRGVSKINNDYYFVAGNANFYPTSQSTNTVYGVFINRHIYNGTWEKGMFLQLSISGITANSYNVHGMERLANGDVLLYGKADKAGKDVAFACAVNVSAANSGSWNIRWSNIYEITNKASIFYNHFIDNSSNIILLGQTDDGGFIVKFPMSATTAAAAKPTGWPKTINGNEATFCGGLAINDNSGYLLVGQKRGTSSGLDVWVVKTDTNAAMSWEKFFGGTGDEAGMAVIEQTDGFIIAGSTLSPEIAGQTKKGTEDIYILKINKDGTLD